MTFPFNKPPKPRRNNVIRMSRRVPPRPSDGDFFAMDPSILAWWISAGLVRLLGWSASAPYPKVEPARVTGAQASLVHPSHQRQPVVATASFGERHEIAEEVPPTEVEEFDDPPPPDQVGSPGRLLGAWQRFVRRSNP